MFKPTGKTLKTLMLFAGIVVAAVIAAFSIRELTTPLSHPRTAGNLSPDPAAGAIHAADRELLVDKGSAPQITAVPALEIERQKAEASANPTTTRLRFFRTLDEPRQVQNRSSASNLLRTAAEDPDSQQIQLRAAVHFSLDQLQSIDVALRPTVAPLHPDGGFHLRPVADHALGESVHLLG